MFTEPLLTRYPNSPTALEARRALGPGSAEAGKRRRDWTVMCNAGSVTVLSALAIYASTMNLACQEERVLELLPLAGAGACSAVGAGGANEFSDGEECVLKEALVHRYSFNVLGATAKDSVGSADGSIVHTTVATEGQLELEGSDSDQYVDLPNGLIDGLTDATFEAWLNWSGGAVWQRIFRFWE